MKIFGNFTFGKISSSKKFHPKIKDKCSKLESYLLNTCLL